MKSILGTNIAMNKYNGFIYFFASISLASFTLIFFPL